MIKNIMKNIGLKPEDAEEIHAKAIEEKIKENPDYPFKPMTEKERAEKAAFEKDRDDFIERMDKFREIRKKMDYIKSNYVPGNGQAGINFLMEQANHLKNMGAEKEFQEVMGMIDKEETAEK